MREGWITLPDDPIYEGPIGKFAKYIDEMILNETIEEYKDEQRRKEIRRGETTDGTNPV